MGFLNWLTGGELGNRDEHHETPCETGGFGWPQNQRNPMGWGNDNPRTIRPAGAHGHEGDHRPTMHGSKSGWRLMSGSGGLIRWDATRERPTGEGPGRIHR